MLNGRPVFPGTSTMNQIERIIEVTNMPPKIDVDAVASPYAATMLESLPVMNYKTIPETFPSATPDGLDVLHACFHFNPDKRPSAEELLRHVFVAEVIIYFYICIYILVIKDVYVYLYIHIYIVVS
jgi:mitogen-activated protein kinase 15